MHENAFPFAQVRGRIQHEPCGHLWRVAGKFSNISIFDVADPAELHEVLNSLPLYPFMHVEVTALCRHPDSLELNK